MGDIILCVCAECPNKKHCRHSIEIADISQFPAMYVVADMSSICHWYKETKENDTEGNVRYAMEWEQALDEMKNPKPMTEEEWLRQASTEELAEFIRKQRDDWSDGWYSDCHRFKEIVEWLKQPHTTIKE